jgi:putative glutamine amidotransferase
VGYTEAVTRAGGLPVLLPPNGSPPEETLQLLDGMILSGGGDIDPALHGGSHHPSVYLVTPERDRFELALTRRALRRPDLPLLGICRGMQVLNVALGGDLEVHLPDVFGERVNHRLPPREPTLHPVRVEPQSVLEEIYGRREFPACSWHPQGVKRLGRGLRPIAYALDGVIEGLVYEAHPFAVGVQWHPEMQVDDDPLQRRLFEAIVERARKKP